jgi:hypothetical protein
MRVLNGAGHCFLRLKARKCGIADNTPSRSWLSTPFGRRVVSSSRPLALANLADKFHDADAPCGTRRHSATMPLLEREIASISHYAMPPSRSLRHSLPRAARWPPPRHHQIYGSETKLLPLRLAAGFQIILFGKIATQCVVRVPPGTKEMDLTANLLIAHRPVACGKSGNSG